MKILVTGSSGHLGEALMRYWSGSSHDVVGIDLIDGPLTTMVGSVVDRAVVARALTGADAVVHTATLHKPHVATHSRRAFVDTNITGTLNLLEESVRAGVRVFIFTSTTSVFGNALRPADGAPAVWVTESLMPRPRNIYGVTKAAAEGLCELVHNRAGLPCIVLRTSRFFPEQDDDAAVREAYDDANIKTVEFLYRRVELDDVVAAHDGALQRAAEIGFGRYIISATTPFRPEDAAELAQDAPSVVRRRVPAYEAAFASRDWRMVPTIDRVYDNTNARRELGWQPRYDFASVLARLRRGENLRGPLACAVGAKGYHDRLFTDRPYPVE